MRKMVVLAALLLTIYYSASMASAASAPAKSPFEIAPKIKDVSCSDGTFTVTFDPNIIAGVPDTGCASQCTSDKIKLDWNVDLYELDSNYQDTGNKKSYPGQDVFCAKAATMWVSGGCFNSEAEPPNYRIVPIVKKIKNVDCSKKYRIVVELKEKDPSKPNDYCAGVDACNALSPDPARNPLPSIQDISIDPKKTLGSGRSFTVAQPTVSANIVPDLSKDVSCEVCFSTDQKICHSTTDTSDAWVKGTVEDASAMVGGLNTPAKKCSASKLLTDGSVIYYGVRGRDVTGNPAVIVSDKTVTVDTKPPTVNLEQLAKQIGFLGTGYALLSWATQDAGGSGATFFQVKKSVNGGDFQTLSFDGSEWVASNGAWDSAGQNNQVNCYKVFAKDNVGNIGESGITCTRFVADCERVNPSVVVGEEKLTKVDGVYSLEFPIKIRNNNNLKCGKSTFSTSLTGFMPSDWTSTVPDKMDLEFGGSGNTVLKFQISSPILTPGIYPIRIQVVDTVGNAITSVTKTFIVDRPYFTLSADQSLKSVVSGNDASYKLALASKSDFSGTVQLSYKNCPKTFTCSFDNSQVTLDEGGTDDATFTVKTTALPDTYDMIIVGKSGNVEIPLFLSLNAKLFESQVSKPSPKIGPTISLKSGWNLISPNFNNFKSTTCQISGNIFGYDAATTFWKIVEKGQMKGGLGYWIKAANDCEITFDVASTVSKLVLSPGWNLVGTVNNQEITREKLRQNNCKIVGNIFLYDANTEFWNIVDKLSPSYGHWINLESSCTLAIS